MFELWPSARLHPRQLESPNWPSRTRLRLLEHFLMGLSNKSHVWWLTSRVLSVCYSALISRYPRLSVSHTWMQLASCALPPKTGRLLPSSDVGHCKKCFSGDSILQKRVRYLTSALQTGLTRSYRAQEFSSHLPTLLTTQARVPLSNAGRRD